MSLDPQWTQGFVALSVELSKQPSFTSAHCALCLEGQLCRFGGESRYADGRWGVLSANITEFFLLGKFLCHENIRPQRLSVFENWWNELDMRLFCSYLLLSLCRRNLPLEMWQAKLSVENAPCLSVWNWFAKLILPSLSGPCALRDQLDPMSKCDSKTAAIGHTGYLTEPAFPFCLEIAAHALLCEDTLKCPSEHWTQIQCDFLISSSAVQAKSTNPSILQGTRWSQEELTKPTNAMLHGKVGN